MGGPSFGCRRDSTIFESKIVNKRQTALSESLDNKILAFYAMGSCSYDFKDNKH